MGQKLNTDVPVPKCPYPSMAILEFVQGDRKGVKEGAKVDL